MVAINPMVVQTPDGRIGCLVARLGLRGCIEFGAERIVGTYMLSTLNYHLTPPPRHTRIRA